RCAPGGVVAVEVREVPLVFVGNLRAIAILRGCGQRQRNRGDTEERQSSSAHKVNSNDVFLRGVRACQAVARLNRRRAKVGPLRSTAPSGQSRGQNISLNPNRIERSLLAIVLVIWPNPAPRYVPFGLLKCGV